jgi:alpha-galactosidase
MLQAIVIASAVITVFMGPLPLHAQIADTPPMGWNSWDAYGFTIDEADFKANVAVLAGLERYGWKFAVIDEGWYMEDPFGDK